MLQTTRWNPRQIEGLTNRIGIRFSPVLGDYMPEGFAVCPTCDNHIIPGCRGPVHGGRVITLTLQCRGCDTRLERDFLEISLGRVVPFYRRDAAF